MFQEFPKWKYSTSGGVIVADVDAEVALGDGWFDFPDEVVHAVEDETAAQIAAAEQATRDLETLRATAIDLGIAVDGRWKAPRLEDEIKAKIAAQNPTDDLV